MEIQIAKEKKELLDEYFGITTEWIIRNKSRYVNTQEESGNIVDFLNGGGMILGAEEEVYEIPNEGTIIYQIPKGTINLSHYVAIVKLLGFNEKESKVFSELKNNLEEVVKAKSGKELIDKFFPEDSKK